jgi:hypothetical protein
METWLVVARAPGNDHESKKIDVKSAANMRANACPTSPPSASSEREIFGPTSE